MKEIIYYKPGPGWSDDAEKRIIQMVEAEALEPIEALKIPEVEGLNIVRDLTLEIQRLRGLLQSMPKSLGITERDILGIPEDVQI